MPKTFLKAALAALVACATLPAVASAYIDEPTGAPERGEVRFTSLMGVPPAGYSLICTGLSNCSTSGVIDLETTSELDVAYDKRKRTARGVGPLEWSKAEGSVRLQYTCGSSPSPWVSRIEVDDTQPGELEVSKISAGKNNTLAVALNHGGDEGDEFPIEVVERTDGGCGTPNQDLTQQMGTWYYHFYYAHQGTQQVGSDLPIGGLEWKNGVFATTIDRFVTVGTPGNTYPLYERTRVEVEPEYCPGKQNRIISATSNGESLGLDGMQFYPGQVVQVPRKAKFRLGDGSAIEVEDGASFTISDCGMNATDVFLDGSIGRFWVHVKKALGGADKKFNVTTERAVAGVRGTIFEVRYDKKRELTRVAVSESSVELKGRNGARGRVIIKKGQVGVQKGKKAPKLVKR